MSGTSIFRWRITATLGVIMCVWSAIALAASPRQHVTNIRVGDNSEYVRVVFDLEEPAVYEEERRSHPSQAIITVKNVVLSDRAKSVLPAGVLPSALTLHVLERHEVRVLLDLNAIQSFRLLSLKAPHRLVFDLFRKAPSDSSSRPDVSPVRLLTDEERLAERTVRTIVLDPGHGGKDPGAMINRSELKEKDIVLDIALRLRRLIEQRLEADVYMTRETDVFVNLEDRVRFANEKGADLFISIHVNAHPSSEIRGVEIYMFGAATDQKALEVAARENGTSLEEAGKIDLVSMLLAEKLLEKKIRDSRELAWSTKTAMIDALGRQYEVIDHGVRTAPLYVLRYTPVPGILAEIAYLTNAKDRRYIASSKYRQRVAEAMVVGLSQYIQTLRVASR